MAEGLPQQTLVGQRYRTPLSAKVFSSWDFCIRVWEAATIKKHEISNELKVREAERAPKHTCVLMEAEERGCVSVLKCAGLEDIHSVYLNEPQVRWDSV